MFSFYVLWGETFMCLIIGSCPRQGGLLYNIWEMYHRVTFRIKKNFKWSSICCSWSLRYKAYGFKAFWTKWVWAGFWRRTESCFASQPEVVLSPVLVHYGCDNKCHRLGGLTNRNYFIKVLEAKSPRSGCQQVWFLLWPLSLNLQQATFSLCSWMDVSLWVCVQSPAPPLWTPPYDLISTCLFKECIFNTVTLGIGASTYEFGGT